MTSWAEKYRPKTLDEVVGNPTAMAELRKGAAAWDKGRPDKRAVVLQGDPGIGKTSAALALANEMGWSVVEMNASESRNAEAIHKVATRGAVLQTFTDTGEFVRADEGGDRKSTRLNSSHRCISYAVFCLKKKKFMINARMIADTLTITRIV